MHRTRIEPEEITLIEADTRRRVVAFRVLCSCGFESPVPLLNQAAANRAAREHREAFDDGPRLHMGLEP